MTLKCTTHHAHKLNPKQQASRARRYIIVYELLRVSEQASTVYLLYPVGHLSILWTNNRERNTARCRGDPCRSYKLVPWLFNSHYSEGHTSILHCISTLVYWKWLTHSLVSLCPICLFQLGHLSGTSTWRKWNHTTKNTIAPKRHLKHLSIL